MTRLTIVDVIDLFEAPAAIAKATYSLNQLVCASHHHHHRHQQQQQQ